MKQLCGNSRLLALMCLTVVGCSVPAFVPPTVDDARSAYFGDQPANYENNIKNCMEAQLRDPYSAIYSFSKPVKGWACRVCPPRYHNDPVTYGYIITTTINAKNAYGGYTGSTPYIFIITPHRTIAHIENYKGWWGVFEK